MSKLSCREFDFDFQTNFKDFEISNKLTLQNNIHKDFFKFIGSIWCNTHI